MRATVTAHPSCTHASTNLVVKFRLLQGQIITFYYIEWALHLPRGGELHKRKGEGSLLAERICERVQISAFKVAIFLLETQTKSLQCFAKRDNTHYSNWNTLPEIHVLGTSFKVKMSWLFWTNQHHFQEETLPLYFPSRFESTLFDNINSNLANDFE